LNRDGDKEEKLRTAALKYTFKLYVKSSVENVNYIEFKLNLNFSPNFAHFVWKCRLQNLK